MTESNRRSFAVVVSGLALLLNTLRFLVENTIALTSVSDMEMCSSVQHGCEHQCVNTPGSYYCVCPEGQLLQDDSKSCGGESDL